MLKSKYIRFKIVTAEKNFTVERRYSDFFSLREEMKKLYPGYLIPPMPEKKVPGTIDNSFIQERKAGLQFFLNEIMVHPLLRNYQLVIDFLSLPEKDWEGKMKTIGKSNLETITALIDKGIKGTGLSLSKSVFNELSVLETIEGEAKLLFTRNTADYCDRLDGSVKGLEDAYRDLGEISKTIVENFGKLANSIGKAASIYARISTIFNCYKETTTAKIYENMKKSHAELEIAFKLIENEYKNNLADFFVYYNREMNAIGEMSERRKNTCEKMHEAEKKLLKKKEQKFEQKGTSGWELDPSVADQAESLKGNKSKALKEMLYKESEEVKKIRMYYGYYSNKLEEEFNRVIKKNAVVFKDHFEKSWLKLAEQYEKLKVICDAGKTEQLNVQVDS